MDIATREIKAGMLLRVHQKIKEGNKERTQVFEGMVIKRRGGDDPSATFTMRKKSGNVWVEKIFPIQLPTIEKVELAKKFKTRRAQLTYLRDPKYKKKMKEIALQKNKTEKIEVKEKVKTEPAPEAKTEEVKPEAIEKKKEE